MKGGAMSKPGFAISSKKPNTFAKPSFVGLPMKKANVAPVV